MLTDHERHLLGEIELQLVRTDPRLASRLTGVRIDRWRFRFRAMQGAVALSAWGIGVALLLGFFTTNRVMGVVGIGHMLLGAFIGADPVARCVRTAGRRIVGRWRPIGARPTTGDATG